MMFDFLFGNGCGRCCETPAAPVTAIPDGIGNPCCVCRSAPVPCLMPQTLQAGGTQSVQLTADAGGATNIALIGSGGAAVKYSAPASLITLSPAEQSAAFVLPAPAVVRCFSASVITSAPVTGQSTAVYAALYAAPADSDTFALVPGSTMMLASALTPALSVGSALCASARLCVRVPAKLVAALFASDLSSSALTGYAQASISVVPAA